MLRTKIVALCTAGFIGLLSPTVASARGGFGAFHGGGGFHGGGFHGGGFRGAGIGLGFGLGVAGAYAAYGYPYGYGYPNGYGGYYGSPYADNGYGDGGCYLVRQRVWTPYGWRLRPVQVCG
jgi:hypothetical protein